MAAEAQLAPARSPLETSVARIALLDTMLMDVALNAWESVERFEEQRWDRIYACGSPAPIPDDFEGHLRDVETNFAYTLADTTLEQLERARAYAREHDTPMPRRVLLLPDWDGSTFPFDHRDHLRAGFMPSVHFLRDALALEDVSLQIGSNSDRPQRTQEVEIPLILHELDIDGTLVSEELNSSNDGEIVKELPPELIATRTVYGPQLDPVVVFERQAAAVAEIMEPEAVHNGDYHEKAVVLRERAYGPNADPETIIVTYDDLSYAANIKPNPRVAGFQTELGELHPPTPDDPI